MQWIDLHNYMKYVLDTLILQMILYVIKLTNF